MKHCVKCGNNVDLEHDYCHHCGYGLKEQKAKEWKKWCNWSILLFIILGIIFGTVISYNLDQEINPFDVPFLIILALFGAVVPAIIISLIYLFFKLIGYRALGLGKALLVILILINLLYGILFIVSPELLLEEEKSCSIDEVLIDRYCCPQGTTEVVDGECTGCTNPELPISIGKYCCPKGAFGVDEERQCCYDKNGECL